VTAAPGKSIVVKPLSSSRSVLSAKIHRCPRCYPSTESHLSDCPRCHLGALIPVAIVQAAPGKSIELNPPARRKPRAPIVPPPAASATHGFFHDAVRDAFRISAGYRAEDINGAKQAELIDRVMESLHQTMQPHSVDVLQLGFATPPRPPESVKQAIESKIAATQLAEPAENEKRQAIAEAAKAVEIARGQAQANDLLTRSLSPQLMQWKQLEILEQKWNGQFPQVVGSNSVPLLQMPSR